MKTLRQSNGYRNSDVCSFRETKDELKGNSCYRCTLESPPEVRKLKLSVPVFYFAQEKMEVVLRLGNLADNNGICNVFDIILCSYHRNEVCKLLERAEAQHGVETRM